MSRSPRNCRTARYMAALDPRLMALPDKRDSNKTNLQRLLQELIDKQRFREQDADGMLRECMKFIDEVVAQDRSRYLSFSPGVSRGEAEDRVDVLLHEMMASNKSFHQLWLVVQQLLLLSHGQSTVERRFSVNKQTETYNLACDNFNAKRLVCDNVSAVGGIQITDVKNKQLLSSCSNARHKYRAFLEDHKKKQAKAASARKRKSADNDVHQLTTQKTNKKSLLTSADEFAEKAEKQHNVSFITKSNALRKAAKEKDS